MGFYTGVFAVLTEKNEIPLKIYLRLLLAAVTKWISVDFSWYLLGYLTYG
jgi:hypothetical protein